MRHARPARHLPLLLVALGLVALLLVARPQPSDALVHEQVRIRTMTYCIVDGASLSMTVFEPAGASRPAPAVLQVHGGAWEHGHRLRSLTQSGSVNTGSLGARGLVEHGFVVASIGYLLAPRFHWPDQIEDVACAMRSLRAHARQLGIDPSRIGALGSSAGGQLVSLLATDPNGPAWSSDPYQGYSARPDALVDEFGPVDLTATGFGPFMRGVIGNVFGVRPGASNPLLAAASPVAHVAAGDPPTLILQGTADTVVPAAQSELFAARLRSAHVPVGLVLVTAGPHGLRNPSEVPAPAALAAGVVSFFVRHLG